MSKVKELLDKYNDIEKELYDLFGFLGYWKMLPIDDMTDTYWFVGNVDDVVWHEKPITKDTIYDEQYYTGTIYKEDDVNKYTYAEYTMIPVDTQCDGNIILMIFDNSKRCMDEEIIEYYEEM